MIKLNKKDSKNFYENINDGHISEKQKEFLEDCKALLKTHLDKSGEKNECRRTN